MLFSNYLGACGTACNEDPLPSVDQIHLSLVDEFNVCVMWNSTHQMEHPTVRYFKGKCTSKKEWIDAYGTQKDYPSGGFIYLATLMDLDSDSTYCYVIGDNCEYSKRYSFKYLNIKR
jgi:hypothetical protein